MCAHIRVPACAHTHTHTHKHTQRGILFSHEKEGNPTIWGNMNLEGIMLSEINQTQKDK